ncbi:MAG: glycosyltransferase [Candidatus Pelagibacter sp.]
MKKIFYWSPHISKVATIKNVVNSAISLKKFNKEKIDVSILDVIGEWNGHKDEFESKKINYIKFSGFEISKLLPVSGYLTSRIIYFAVLVAKIFKLKKLIDKEKPNYLIIHLITVVPLLLLYLFSFDTKFILRISGLPKLTFFRIFFWKKISNKIYMVTCPSEETKKDLMKFNIFPEEKLKVIYDPILEIKEIHRKLNYQIEKNLLNNKNYFLNIGRLTKQKNQALLINVFSKLLKNNNNLYLYIAGDGEKKKILKKMIVDRQVQNNVFLLGYCENVFPLIKNSSAVISTSLWEDPGAVMVESAYCNKLVISSNCPNGPKEFLQYGECGYLFKNNDPIDLENKINQFLNENENVKFKKAVISKKKSKMYSLFRHYQKLNKILV